MKTLAKLALPLLSPLMLLGFSQTAMAQQEPEPLLVELDQVQSAMVAEQIWVSGTVMSRTDANLAAEVAGRLSWVAGVGDVVEKGGALARIDDRLFQIDHEQNIANIAKWEARVKLLEKRRMRVSKMTKLNNTSRDELDEVISELEVAQQELAQANLDKAQSAYMLEQTRVTAPFRALVVERFQSFGEYTAVGQDLIRVVDTNNVEASIRAPLSSVPFIRVGEMVEVKDKFRQQQEKVRVIVPVGNAISRMMEVRVALRAGDFPIGSAVRVALPNSDYHQALTVHRDALVLRKNGTYVFHVDANEEAVMIPVETGIGLGERIEILGDLPTSGNVIVRGAERVKEGQKVRFDKTLDLARAP